MKASLGALPRLVTACAVVLFWCCMTALPCAGVDLSGTLTVKGVSNIFGAGHATAPAPEGGAGELPPVFSFTAAPARALVIESVTGTVSCCGPTAHNGPDGNGHASGTTDILSHGGISGIVNNDATMFLVGVFVGPGEPEDPAPDRLDVTGGTDRTDYNPVLNQVFFIGDGFTGTGSGTRQRFHVPETATRLFLGFADALEFGYPQSLPGYYWDNEGELSVTFTITEATGPAVHPSCILPDLIKR
jgi:hypothetical protein